MAIRWSVSIFYPWLSQRLQCNEIKNSFNAKRFGSFAFPNICSLAFLHFFACSGPNAFFIANHNSQCADPAIPNYRWRNFSFVNITHIAGRSSLKFRKMVTTQASPTIIPTISDKYFSRRPDLLPRIMPCRAFKPILICLVLFSLSVSSFSQINIVKHITEANVLPTQMTKLQPVDTQSKNFQFLNFGEGSFTKVIHSGNSVGNIDAAIFNCLHKMSLRLSSFNRYGYKDRHNCNAFDKGEYAMKNSYLPSGQHNSFRYFNRADLKDTFVPPDVRIKQAKISDKLESGTLTRDYSKNVKPIQYLITTTFASLYFSALARINDLYLPGGITGKWLNTGSAHSVADTILSSGNHLFKVKPIYDTGAASKKQTWLRISIMRLLYKSWWFLILSGILVLAFTCSFGYYRIYYNKNLANIRGRIASDLHDDIGSTLNSISIYSEVASQLLQSDAERARAILEKMGSASRSMIDNMNDIVWSINPQNDDFENILLRMQYFAAELLSAKNILLQFDIDVHLKKIKLSMEKRKNFYLIYKEAINNACKYSGSKMVNVCIAEKERHIVMIITDNGKGFDIITNGLGGNGLTNMKMRAKEIGANFEVNSWPGKGTRVYLNMRT